MRKASTMAAKISVIMPTYNSAKTVLKAIESIYEQTYQNFEILIIDDSDDSTTEVIKSYKNFDSRIKLIKN